METKNIRNYTSEADAKFDTDKYKEACSYDEINKFKDEYIQDQVAESIASIADTLNGGDVADVVAGMLKGLRVTHRYIQSEFWKGMVEFIKQTGELDKAANFDGRNEWTQDLCKRMYVAGWYPESVNMDSKA